MYSARDMMLDISAACYDAGREITSAIDKYSRKIAGQHGDYETVVRFGEMVVRNTPDIFWSHPVPKGLETEFLGIRFKSPVVIASFKGDYGVLRKWESLGASAITKTIMMSGRSGNDRPRHITYEGADNLEKHINAYGLPSKGVMIEMPLLLNSGILDSGTPFGTSIGGESIAEYLFVYRHILESSKIRGAIKNKQFFNQVNAGCPNSETGHNVCKIDGAFGELMEGLSGIEENFGLAVPQLVKVPPYIKGMNKEESDNRILEIAEICECFDNVGMTLANTKPVDIANCDPYIAKACAGLSTKGGGLSGPDCTARALELTEMILSEYDIPISLCGGIRCAEDVVRGKEAGAGLFEIATAVGQNPYRTIAKTNRDLAGMRKEGL